MPFTFWGGLEAEVEFRDDFMTVHRSYGYTGSYPKQKTEESWKELREFSKASKTAMNLFIFIEGASQIVHVVGMSGGFQCFGSAQGQDQKKSVIFVDLDAKLNIKAQTTHNLHLDIKKMAKIWKGQVNGVALTELDNRITLLHEMGHARQWIEKPGWFDHDYRTATKISDEEKAPQMKEVTALEIYQKAKLMHLKSVVKSFAAGRTADLSFLPDNFEEVTVGDKKKRRQKLAAPVGWGVPIEHDNMRRHEWPICREMGLPLRTNYGDIEDSGRSAKNRSLDSHLNAWIREEEEQQRQKQAARIDIPTGQKQCDHPGCTFVGSNIQVMRHRLSVHN